MRKFMDGEKVKTKVSLIGQSSREHDYIIKAGAIGKVLNVFEKQNIMFVIYTGPRGIALMTSYELDSEKVKTLVKV